jgi:transcriptional regulator with XRE-family HTH domain
MKDANHPQRSPETIGKRIAQLRQAHSWTQQGLANRLSISRVAVSHIEMDLSIPSERTITLLAGLFKQSPYQLVRGTSYPAAKAERLPEIACCYTKLELELAIMENDLAWLSSLASVTGCTERLHDILEKWRTRLAEWAEEVIDEREREAIAKAQKRLAACEAINR